MKARENPFNTDRLDKIPYHHVKGTWENLIKRLAGLNYRAAITGPHGSGKTTLLNELEEHLHISGFGTKKLSLNMDKRYFDKHFLNKFFEEISAKDIILFDGADLMGRIEWRRFKQKSAKAAGLIVTSHRASLLPLLVKCSTTPQLLEKIVYELLGEESDDLHVTVKALFYRHRGNLHNALREFYDIYASHDSPNDIVIE